jgi:glycine cleavage system H protein
VNQDPYGAGWLFTVEVTSTGDLLSAEEYAAQITD